MASVTHTTANPVNAYYVIWIQHP
ncbi:unnamed protein product [Fusarium venenatum]|uniref:Uncharacterized protein n=1 Tax=Fusarium venenatum TaxID=56646 RepID=A0A2L2TQE3_9HYPO|nr:unnamed protein product [Fusarium venenatum]